MRLHLPLFIALGLATTGCLVGPKYSKPTAPMPPAFKEQIPPEFKEANSFRVGQPRDDSIRGKWWELFGDPQLNALEEQVQVSNQNVAQAEAQYRQARAAVRVARADLFPTVTAGVGFTRSHQSANRGVGRGFTIGTQNDFNLPVDFSWEPDLWGRVRRNIEANAATAQASAGDLENIKLSMRSELATDYFSLRALDAEKQLLDSTVAGYQKALDLTRDRYNQGIASGVDVAQAETQLESTQAQATDLGVQRAQLEHAIAILAGKPPSELSIPVAPLAMEPPPVPVALPSELLERRPDVAAAERRVAASNAQIGVAEAAYYPNVSLSAAAGLESASFVNWFSAPSRLWSIGPSLVETIFDAGRRRGATAAAIAANEATVAVYRESVLTAFQEVEDNLAALRILSDESKQQADAVRSAERSLEITNNRYRGGITTYLEVVTAQTTALANERSAVEILGRRMTASVNLIKALGGGWNTSSLPSTASVVAK